MKGLRCWALTLWLVLFAVGCPPQVANEAPAAATPFDNNVFAVLKKHGSFVHVPPAASGNFEILPGGLPSGGMRFVFRAPWPVGLKVTLHGAQLPRFEDIPAGTSHTATGYYKVLSVDPNPSPSIWTIGVRPPDANLGMTRYDVTIATVSLNPKFGVGTPENESAPMTVRLDAQKVFSVAVFKTGTGRGTVTSSPPGIQCGIDCLHDFGPSGTTTVQLQAQAAAGSTFNGWSSDQTTCLGTGPCGLSSTGSALSATADFSGSSPALGSGCAGPKDFPGFMYIGNPSCASNDVAGHPSAFLACDVQGYFCCEDATGSNEPRCGGTGKRQFPADCMDYGPQAQFKELRGCYTSN